jgi:hypothetical protein
VFTEYGMTTGVREYEELLNTFEHLYNDWKHWSELKHSPDTECEFPHCKLTEYGPDSLYWVCRRYDAEIRRRTPTQESWFTQMENPMGSGENQPRIQTDPAFPFTLSGEDSGQSGSGQTAKPETEITTDTAEVEQQADGSGDIDPSVRTHMRLRPARQSGKTGSIKVPTQSIPNINTGAERRITPPNPSHR